MWNLEVMKEEEQNSNEQVLVHGDCESLMRYKTEKCK